MTEMLQTLIGSTVTLEIQGNDQPYWVDADPGQFDTAIVNMAANARDAMNNVGHLKIALRRVAALPAMRQHTAVKGQFIAISMSDTGAGIAESELAKIFEPFFTTKPVGRGTGLGLSQVFGFAKQAHGDVQVESTVGQGTTFTIYLPAAIRQQDKILRSEDQLVATQTCGTVLLVEDNRNVAAMVQTALEDMGYDVHLSHNGADALEILKQTPDRFVVMFTDVMMAGMDGITLAHEVRRLYPSLPVLLASGYSSVLASSEDRGFLLVAKPYGPDSLTEALHRAIRSQKPENRLSS